MKDNKKIILGIESSCDDTSAAVLADGLLLSNVIASQDVHAEYGGVVPELASRAHQQNIVPVVDAALKRAGVSKEELDAIAFTRGPGLLGSLLVGTSFAKGMSLGLRIPLVDVNHLQGHVLSHFIRETPDDEVPEYPFLCLLVSGGNSQLIVVRSDSDMEIIGHTIDDAAGEAFDKCAKVMGLPYPGGPAVSALADKGRSGAIELARPMIHSPNLDMSFSGLKTSVLTAVRNAPNPEDEVFRADLARGFVDAVTDVLAAKLIRAMKQTKLKRVVVAGGVSANRQLRERLISEVKKRRGEIFFPPMRLCTDNGAMIAAAGLARFERMTPEALESLRGKGAFGVKPRWQLTDTERL